MIDEIFQAVWPMWALISVGVVLKRWIVRSPSYWGRLDTVFYYVILPLMILSILGRTRFDETFLSDVGWVFLAANLAIFALLIFGYLMSPTARALAPAYSSAFQTASRWNIPIGLFLSASIFQNAANDVAAAVFIASIPLVNLVNVIFMEVTLRGGEGWPRRVVVSTISNPILIACGMGVVMAVSQVSIPPLVATGLDWVWAIGPTLMLLSVGAGLSFSTQTKQSALIALSCAAKLIWMPLSVMAFALVFGVTGDYFIMCVIFAAAPTAPNGYVLARQLGGDAPLYSSTLVLQTLLSFATLPMWMWLAGRIAG